MLKKIIFGVVLATAASGCSYGAVAALGPDRIVVARNDNLLFGALRKIYICKVTPNGLTDCVETREDEKE